MTTLTGTAAAAERSVTSIPPLTHAEAGIAQPNRIRTHAGGPGAAGRRRLDAADLLHGLDGARHGGAPGGGGHRQHLRGRVCAPEHDEPLPEGGGRSGRRHQPAAVGGTGREEQRRAGGRISHQRPGRGAQPAEAAVGRAQAARADGAGAGLTPLEYLLDTLYPRDQWMHRYDICAATGKKMVVTPEHDGRLTALVVRDIDRKLKGQLGQRSLALNLNRRDRGRVCVWPGVRVPPARCRWMSSTFICGHQGASRQLKRLRSAVFGGDRAAGEWFLQNMEVVY